jgi:hypothetical protein
VFVCIKIHSSFTKFTEIDEMIVTLSLLFLFFSSRIARFLFCFISTKYSRGEVVFFCVCVCVCVCEHVQDNCHGRFGKHVCRNWSLFVVCYKRKSTTHRTHRTHKVICLCLCKGKMPLSADLLT